MKLRIIATILAIISALAFNLTAHAKDKRHKAHDEASTIKNVIPDATITTAIKSKYLGDEEISGLKVHVETINGKVTLTGAVPNKHVEERAVSIAKNTNGVKEVVSKLAKEGKAGEESSTAGNVIPDATVTAAVKSKYLADEEISGLDVHVETVNGKVTLRGTVPSKHAEERAVSIAKNTNGVKEVVSRLEIHNH
jgi:osmotically-inducible protein OsmY